MVASNEPQPAFPTAPAQAPAYVPPAPAPVHAYEPAPLPARLAVAEPLPTPPEPVRAPAPPAPPAARYAALPTPPIPTVQTASATGYINAPHPGFRLVGPAYAAPAPVYRGGAGQWAIQVGAFGNEGLAHIAVGNAREQAGAVLSAAKPAVAGVKEGHGTLYRARLMGLSRESATQACDKLKGRSSCIVLSPDAQS